MESVIDSADETSDYARREGVKSGARVSFDHPEKTCLQGDYLRDEATPTSAVLVGLQPFQGLCDGLKDLAGEGRDTHKFDFENQQKKMHSERQTGYTDDTAHN